MSINDNFRWLNVGLPEDILRRKLCGDFAGAVRLIDQRLRGELPQSLRACLTAQREMILRTPEEYPYDTQAALARVRSFIPSFSEEEFWTRVDAGQIGWIYRDGTPYFFDRFLETLCKAEPDFAKRAGVRLPGVESAAKGSLGAGRLDHCVQVMEEKGEMSLRIRIRACVRLHDDQFQPGMFLRVHLPIPIPCEHQSDIVIEQLSPATGRIAPEDAPQRTVCWEEYLPENHEFSVVYSYTQTAIYHSLFDRPCALTQPTFDTEEVPPHIQFTPYLRDLAQTLSLGAKDPLEKAKRFYDFITKKMRYTFMPSYFILEAIPENCARSFTGDCGVFALLFLTLCRCVGIPAQWQSGFAAEPDFCGGHDWVRFYVAPYGWLYADPSYGIAGVREGSEKRRQFYFGNIDPYRMVANSAFQAPFTVEKQYWRADPYDNQVGEMESANRGMQYADFERTKEVLLCQGL